MKPKRVYEKVTHSDLYTSEKEGLTKHRLEWKKYFDSAYSFIYTGGEIELILVKDSSNNVIDTLRRAS